MPEPYVTATLGTVFAISSLNGDILAGTTDGLYSSDTRYISNFRLLLEGKATSPVGVDRYDSSTVSFYCVSHEEARELQPALSVVRDRSVSGKGLHEDIYIRNDSLATKSFGISFAFASDFADVFEVRRGTVNKMRRDSKLPPIRRSSIKGGLVFEYHHGAFDRRVRISLSNFPIKNSENPEAHVVSLPPKRVWSTCVSISPSRDGRNFQDLQCSRKILEYPFGKFERNSQKFLKQGGESRLLESLTLPERHTRDVGVRQSYYHAIYDLSSLELEIIPKKFVFAAGLPWFMALFGRDSAISAIQTKILGTDLLVNTVATLASLQADKVDEFREAQPGKIPHEVRFGELSVLGEVPHSRYYGSIDSTPLFVMLLWEAYQWTGDLNFLKKYIPAGRKAVEWIDKYGDLDGDGFVEYQGRSRNGLRNQGWKDSNDSVSFESGVLAEPPIALSEVQGYVYAAKTKMADLYRVLGDSAGAEKLEAEALTLKKKFNSAFWMPSRQYFALALDGHKKRVDSISSNPGHCLWTGIVDGDKASLVVKRLISEDMFTGWGVRTLSSKMARYNPLSYHNGSVWPHDNSIICAGMAIYGFFKEASLIATSMLEAANGFPEHRLPELFAGYVKREHSKPIPYPAANSPQAWASGAVIYYIETLLGLAISDGNLIQRPRPEGTLLSLTGVNFRGTRIVL